MQNFIFIGWVVSEPLGSENRHFPLTWGIALTITCYTMRSDFTIIANNYFHMTSTTRQTSCQFSSVIGCNTTANPQQVVAKLHCFDLLWICCRRQICCGFVVDLLYSFRFVVDLSWICYGFVVDLLYNKFTTNRISGVYEKPLCDFLIPICH